MTSLSLDHLLKALSPNIVTLSVLGVTTSTHKFGEGTQFSFLTLCGWYLEALNNLSTNNFLPHTLSILSLILAESLDLFVLFYSVYGSFPLRGVK